MCDHHDMSRGATSLSSGFIWTGVTPGSACADLPERGTLYTLQYSVLVPTLKVNALTSTFEEAVDMSTSNVTTLLHLLL